ncbi:hypothetical protein CVT26_008613 [Gymnopilus dilepis]|uniref:Uncharacterized protein n=1 Tax=Gymnopilus dilepis TaxID=231916 RepID=A0A409XXY2_9AGAR|nr:hypothetical protein CVT26_008613 [Gymnopilus dilepis]
MPGLAVPTVSNLSTLFKSVRLGALNLLGQKKDIINRLPDETLSEIFLHATALLATETFPPLLDDEIMCKTPVISQNNQSTPFPLSQVCRRWRAIVQHTSSMWRSIAILHPNKRHLYRTKLWLTYARNQELDIMIDQSSDLSEEEIETTSELLKLLAHGKRLYRWSSLDVQLCREAAYLLSTQLDELRLAKSQALCTANIWILEPMDENVVDTMWKALNGITSLYELQWRADGSRVGITPSHTFGRQLQFLKISIPVPVDHAIRNLRYCSDLKVLTLHFSGLASSSSSILPFVELKHLDTLVVRSTDPLVDFFLHCTFPSLKSLEVDQITETEAPYVLQMLRRSRCELQVFVARFPRLSSDTLIDWIKSPSLQSLETLCLAGVDVTDEVLTALTWPPSDTCAMDSSITYLPKLEHLGLTHCGPSITSDIFIRMLGSRFWPAPQRGTVGHIKNVRAELITAILTVSVKTSQMEQYERTIKDCASRTEGWGERRLTIQEA